MAGSRTTPRATGPTAREDRRLARSGGALGASLGRLGWRRVRHIDRLIVGERFAVIAEDLDRANTIDAGDQRGSRRVRINLAHRGIQERAEMIRVLKIELVAARDDPILALHTALLTQLKRMRRERVQRRAYLDLHGCCLSVGMGRDGMKGCARRPSRSSRAPAGAPDAAVLRRAVTPGEAAETRGGRRIMWRDRPSTYRAAPQPWRPTPPACARPPAAPSRPARTHHRHGPHTRDVWDTGSRDAVRSS